MPFFNATGGWMESIKSFLPKLDNPQKIVITTHPNPDADALGSSLGLYHYLHGRGHEVSVITPTDYPDFLFWMPGNETVIAYCEEKKQEVLEIIGKCDIIFCLDFSNLSRLKDMESMIRESDATKVLIDHHRDPEDFADYQLWSTEASATAELIFDFIDMIGDKSKITEDISNCLYAGILTDTGSFKHPSTTAKVHRIVAELIELKADVNKVNRAIYDTNSLDRLRFIGYALLKKLVVKKDLNIAYFVIDLEDRKRFSLKSGDTEGLVNYALSIFGIVMATIIIEREDEVKMSFRSVGDYAVNLFASDHFEGGGHKNASGGVSKLSLNETIEKFEGLLPSFKKDYYKIQT